MKALSKLVALLGLALALGALHGCGDVRAAATKLTWTTATKYANGDALAASEIAGTQVQWGTCGGPYNAGAQLVPSPATEMPLPVLPAGSTCFVAFTVLTDAAVAAREAAGKPTLKLSRASNEARTVVPTEPGAPANLGVS